MGAHLQIKFRKKRIGKRMAIVFYSILGAVAEEAYFLPAVVTSDVAKL